MKYLVVIPARGGSKGIPGKNIKKLHGKPLIHYSIDLARQIADDIDICLTTDSDEILECAKQVSLKAPFIRPDSLSGDKSGMEEVLLHAVEEYKKMGKEYDTIVLLQPTSPFRTFKQLQEAIALYSIDLDMVVSVSAFEPNPYYLAQEENDNGLLQKSFPGDYKRRQDCPEVFAYNGAIYIVNIESLKEKGFSGMDKKKKYLMGRKSSLDLDTLDDWEYAEFILTRRNNNKN